MSHLLIRTMRSVFSMLLSLGGALLVWIMVLKVLNLNPYFAKSPADVYNLLFVGSGASAQRSVLWSGLLVTLRDAALGFICGTAAAIVVAFGVVLRRGFAQTFMPVAIALRSVPLVAMTPLLTLVFGQGLLTVGIVSGIVTFFPSLVNLVQGLRVVTPQSRELFHAYGASERTILLKLQIPFAVPSLFTAAKIAAPGALLGAVIAEWLATGTGLGYIMTTAANQSQYALLWATIVAITAVSVILYNVVGVVERTVAERFGSPA